MITVYRSTPQGVAQISEPVDGCWIHLVNPDLEELEQVQHAYSIPPDYLTYPLDQDEMARTEKDEGVTLVILRVARYQGETSCHGLSLADFYMAHLGVGVKVSGSPPTSGYRYGSFNYVAHWNARLRYFTNSREKGQRGK